MNKIKLIILFLVWSFVCMGQQISVFNDTEFNKNKFSNSNNDIKRCLEDVRIIGLGEGTHNIGSVFQAKVKVTKYLHEELGYDVIAFESGLYDMSKANEALKSDSVKAKDIFSGLFGLWWTQEVKELIDYIIETQKTDKPLMIAGFDNQFSAGKDDLGRFYDDFKSFVDTCNLTTKSRVSVDSSFINALNVEIRYSNSFSKVPERDTLALSHV